MESSPRAPYLLLCGVNGDRNMPLVERSSWKLGRGSQSSIVLIDDLVSRNHALIQRMDTGEYFLIDMGSRNGSFVNERRGGNPPAVRGGDPLSGGHGRRFFFNPL